MSSAITLDALSKHFPGQSTAAVQQVSLAIEPGEIFVVMGLSGSGKSTLLRMINGLIQPSSGSVAVRGQTLSDLSKRELNRLRRQASPTKASWPFRGARVAWPRRAKRSR